MPDVVPAPDHRPARRGHRATAITLRGKAFVPGLGLTLWGGRP